MVKPPSQDNRVRRKLNGKNFESLEELFQSVLSGGDERTMSLYDLKRWLLRLVFNPRFLEKIPETKISKKGKEYKEVLIGIYEDVNGGVKNDKLATEKYLTVLIFRENSQRLSDRRDKLKHRIFITKTDPDTGEVQRKIINIYNENLNIYKECEVKPGSEFAIVLDFDNSEDEDDISGDNDFTQTVQEADAGTETGRVAEQVSEPEKKNKSKKVRVVRKPKQKRRDTVEGRKELLRKREWEDFTEKLDRFMNNLSTQTDSEIIKKNKSVNIGRLIELFKFMHGKRIDSTLLAILNSDRKKYHKALVLLAIGLTITKESFSDSDITILEKILHRIKIVANQALSFNKTSLISTEGAAFIGQKSDRDIANYIILLCRDALHNELHYDTNGQIVDPSDLHNAPPLVVRESQKFTGFTLDIGGGLTFQNPLSLMNYVNSEIPDARYVSLDPMYSEETNPWSRMIEGNNIDINNLDAEIKKNLIPGFAQNIPFENETVDRVVSVWAFDKFNEEAHGTQQALREITRVLKPDGEVRIHGLRKSQLDLTTLEKYFTVEFTSETLERSYDIKNETLLFVKLKRKKLSKEDLESLENESSDWKIKYLT